MLALRDTGAGPASVLLHGLAGDGGEWDAVAAALDGRVVAPDARGHGASGPGDMSPAAHVADVVEVIGTLGLAPVVLVGQSLGGLTALQVAAERPELVCGLVLVDAGPGDGEGAAEHARDVARRLPARFPGVDVTVMETWLREAGERDSWRDWARLACPVLVVRGTLPDDYVAELRDRAEIVDLDAGHDVHLERPAQLAAAINRFGARGSRAS